MKYLILFYIPVIIVIDLYLWSMIADLLTTANDLAVFLGVLSICTAVLAHYLIFKSIKSKLKL